MKKVFLSLLLCAFNLTLPAKAIIYQNDFDGFYVGIEGGGSFTTAKENAQKTGAFFYPVPGTFHLHSLEDQSWAKEDALKGVINAGYGYSWQVLYLGLEIFGSLSDYQMNTTARSAGLFQPSIFSSSVDTFDSHVKLRSFEYGVDLRPGILINPRTMLYGRVGIAMNRLSLNTSSVSSENFFPPIFTLEMFPVSLDSSTDKNVAALRLGLGIADQIMPPLSVQLDYIYTDYGNINVNNSFSTTANSVNRGPIFITVASNAKVKVTNNTVLLGLSYNFQNLNRTTATQYWSSINGGMLRGFYVGGSGGGSFTNANGNVAALGDFGALIEHVPFQSFDDVSEKSLAGSLYTGYGFLYNYFYFAPEAFVKVSQFRENTSGAFGLFNASDGIPVSFTQTTVNTTTKLNPVEYGLDLRPGLIVGCNTLIYGRIGTAINKLSLSTNATTKIDEFPPLFPVPETLSAAVSSSTSKIRAALRLGGGIEQRLNQYFSIRGDYIYTDYGNISTSKTISVPVTSVNFIPPNAIITVNASAHKKITNNTVLLGFSFYPNI